MPETDILVIGSGIAGLTYALKCAEALPSAQITIITKGDESESNTKYAQGGIAVVQKGAADSFQNHIEDTLKAGDGLCDLKVVETVVKEGPERLAEIIEWGTRFDMTKKGNYDLGKEGGHSVNRIVHHKDVTGFEIERALLARVNAAKNINFLSKRFVVDLLTEHHLKEKPESSIHCFGAYVLNPDTGKIERFLSRITLLASGGAGQVYRSTTNPSIATGDGIAMAYRAKALIKNMEFIQFHPTTLYEPGKSPAFLISEAVRGFGAKLRTKDGKAFMQKYDEREELASRDIVARAIDSEMKARGDEYVMLDCRHLDMEKFRTHFPNIYNKCKSIAILLENDMIPVVPAAHYLCGGIVTDLHGKTSVEGLYACGECACTGLHGANRLASNSLLEALVFAHRCFLDAQENIGNFNLEENAPEWNAEGTTKPKELVQITYNKRELQNLMSDLVGIVRSDKRLALARQRLKLLYEDTESLYRESILSPQLCELRNLINVAHLIIKQSAGRKENRGGYYNLDRVERELSGEI